MLLDIVNAYGTCCKYTGMINARIELPQMARLLFNFGRVNETVMSLGRNQMYYDAGGGSLSQGHPAAPLLYALASKRIPAITLVDGVSQKWYIDDGHCMATGRNKLVKLRESWTKLEEAGRRLGFKMHGRKCAVVVPEEDVDEATEIFADTGVPVRTGHVDLGARSTDWIGEEGGHRDESS